MTTFGLSYTRGVFFYNPQRGIAHAAVDRGKLRTDFFPWGAQGILFMLGRVLTTLPWYLYLVILACLLLGVMPYVSNEWGLPPLPLYSLLVVALGYHFAFPIALRRFHGAEHKVFSHRGLMHIRELDQIERANIVNRGCSTNSVVLFFLIFLATIPFVGGWIASGLGVLALVVVPRFVTWCDRRVVFPISAWFQKHVTTAEPEELHLKVAIISYVSLKTGRALTEVEAWEEACY